MAALTTQQEAQLFRSINALPLAEKQRMWDAMNRILDRDPMGASIRNRARALTMGLSGGLGDWGTALATGITALATTAATVGLAVYDKRKANTEQARQDEAAMQVAMAQIQAQKDVAATSSVQTSHLTEYALFGAGGLAVIGLLVWGFTHGSRSRR